MNCAVCGELIPRARLRALPDTRVCVRHSTESKVEGVIEYGHKTAGTIVILPKDPEMKRRALRAHRRGR
jgi:hypothetical protein